MRALIHLSVCTSIDGRIALGKNERSNSEKYDGWTSSEDKDIFRERCAEADFLIVGANTFRLMPKMGKPVVLISSKQKVEERGVIKILPPDPTTIEGFLQQFGKSTALLCGGSLTYRLFLEAGLVDKITMVVEPIVLNSGPFFCGEGDIADPKNEKFKYTLKYHTTIGRALRLEFEKWTQ